MTVNLNNYKCAGVIYRIDDMEFTKKSNYPKRTFYVEVPTMRSMSQGTEIFKFMVMGEQTKSLDWYNAGDWVEILFRIEGRWWKPPDEDKQVHLSSLRPIDIHKGDNPFEGDYQINQDPDDLSPDPMAELAKNVKDYSQDSGSLPFDRDDDNDENDLPF